MANNTVVTLDTTPGIGRGDITVNAPVIWSTNTLELKAAGNIIFNASLTGGKLTLFYEQGSASGSATDYVLNNGATISFTGTDAAFTTQKGNASALKKYNIVSSLGEVGSTDVTTLQGISSKSSTDNYVLGTDINAQNSGGWNGVAGFIPLAKLLGTLDGLGHTVDGLYMRSTNNNVGLFSSLDANSEVRNLGLTKASITGVNFVGGIA